MKVPRHMLTERAFAELKKRYETGDGAVSDLRACIVTIETMSKQIRRLHAEAKTRKHSKPID